MVLKCERLVLVLLVGLNWACQKQATPDDEESASETAPANTSGESETAAAEDEDAEGVGTREEADEPEGRKAPPETSDYDIESEPGEHGLHFAYSVVDGDGEPVELPEEVEQELEASRQPALFADGRYLLYSGSPDEPEDPVGLMIYDFHRDRQVRLGGDVPAEQRLITFGPVSPSQRHVLAVTTNEPRDTSYLLVYTIDDGEVVASRRAGINPHIRCNASCRAREVEFKDNETVVYLQQASVPAPQGDQKQYVEVKLDEMLQ